MDAVPRSSGRDWNKGRKDVMSSGEEEEVLPFQHLLPALRRGLERMC